MSLIGGKYRLLKQLGEGAMGVVWSAQNTTTGGQVALKLILRSEAELRARLMREAQACGAIRHKNVVQVYDVGTTDSGDPFLVMELLQGETLAALLSRKRRLPPHEACALARDVARALAAAHAATIVHRDLKPANIFLHIEPGDDEPIVKVVDFGVSKNLQLSDGLRTVAGGAVGSPMYMSPEQARADRNLDHRADLWSLGVVLYEMLTGERPFSGDAVEVVHKILQEPIPRVGKRLRKLDPDIDRIVSGCLTRNVEERLGPAAEIARQLDKHTLGAPRDPLPSLMDTGAYDPSPTSCGSVGAALSPGYGTAPLAPVSPGIGRTDLRPPSGGAALTPKSGGHGGTALSAAASVAAELHRPSGWGPPDEDGGATIPIDPAVVQARLARGAASPPAQQVTTPMVGPAALPTRMAAPAVLPTPAAGPAAVAPAPPSPADWAAAGGGTIPLSAAPANVIRSVNGSASSPAAVRARLPLKPAPKAEKPADLGRVSTVMMDAHIPPVDGPALPPPPAPLAVTTSPRERKSRKKIWVASAVMLASALAAVAVWLLGPQRGETAPMPPSTSVVKPPSPPPAPSVSPSGAAEPSATNTISVPTPSTGQNPSTNTTSVPSAPTAQGPAPSSNATSAPSTAQSPPPSPVTTSAKALSPPTSGPRPALTGKVPASQPKTCKSKFGTTVPCTK